tara:strand:+ start:54 stop:680 length:627 start_codon:yes stop_codon:yes gene_type:complete
MEMKFYALKLSGIMIIVFALQAFISGFTDVFVLNESAYFEVWRFVTAVFLHGGIGHLLYNLFALALFGTLLEGIIGPRRFMLVFFITGILANIISLSFYPSSLGASGAIFGVIGALIVVRPLMMVWAFGVPMPIFIAGILWAGGDLIGAYSYLANAPINNTGNIAHLSGMAIGLLMGIFYREKKSKKQELIKIDERSMRYWEDRNLRR